MAARSERDYDQRRRDSQTRRIRSSARWQKIQRAILAAFPLCEDPFHQHGSTTIPAREVHHIQPLHLRPDLAFARSNLMALCARCHNRIERQTNESQDTL